MTERHTLGRLQMREPGHDAARMVERELREVCAKRGDEPLNVVDLAAQIEPHRGRHLIVARAPRMQLLAGIADLPGERRLDVHVHIF